MWRYIRVSKDDHEVEPCRCGNEHPLLFKVDGVDNCYGMECKFCGNIVFISDTPEKAIDEWNRQMRINKHVHV